MKKRPLLLEALCFFSLFLVACQTSTAPLHRGRVPFRWMESVPYGGEAAFTFIEMHRPGSTMLKQVRAGDVIAFHMSHAEARAHLRATGIQKLPYELFRYGHVALVVPHSDDLRLLQTSMSETANVKYGMGYLRDKSWSLFRPQRVDTAKLAAFAHQVTTSKPARYDMTATLGLWNRGLRPKDLDHTATRYTCATLVVAALHYADCPLRVSPTAGVCDLITPGQVVRARMQMN
jgi:hypothetical protein